MVVKFAPTEVKMSSDGVLVTPVELNRNLLNSYFKFKPQAKLESFITRKLEVKKTIFTLAEVGGHRLCKENLNKHFFVAGPYLLERYH